jgi:hypothetical protein
VPNEVPRPHCPRSADVPPTARPHGASCRTRTTTLHLRGVFCFLLFGGGGAFTIGHPAPPPPPPKKNTDLPLAGPDQARSLRLSPSRSLSTAGRRDPRTSPPYPAPSTPAAISAKPPPPPPDPLACDLQLASAAVSAARRDSAASHPGRVYFSRPSKEDLRLRPPHRSPPALPHVEQLHPDWHRLAVFDEIPARHLFSSSFLVEGAYTQQVRAHSIRRLHPSEAARPALMSRAAHAVESKAVVLRVFFFWKGLLLQAKQRSAPSTNPRVCAPTHRGSEAAAA